MWPADSFFLKQESSHIAPATCLDCTSISGVLH